MHRFSKYFWIIAFAGLCVFTSGCAGTLQGSNQGMFAGLNTPDAIVDAGTSMVGETPSTETNSSKKDYNSEQERYFHLGVFYQHIRH